MPVRWNFRKVLVVASFLLTAGGVPVARGQLLDKRVKPAQAQPRAEPAAAKIAPPVDPKRLARLLAQWEQESSRLKTLDVDISRVDKDPAWDEDEHYQGRALLKSPDLAWLDFGKVAYKNGMPVRDKNGDEVVTPWERIICTGKEVWQYKSDSSQIFIFPLDANPNQRALDEGPLPFLFNFREAEARQRYDMNLIEERPQHYWIGISPKNVKDRDVFIQAFIQLDKELFLPTRIYLIAPNGKSKKDFKLTKIKPNVPVMPKNFEGTDPGPPWKVVDNRQEPGPNPGRGQAKPPAPAAGRPVRQPAMKPAGSLRGRGN